MKCRGLIYNHNNNLVVSRPPVKFWNINDAKFPETSEAYLSTEVQEASAFRCREAGWFYGHTLEPLT
jgi:hypothetical protein